MLTFGENGSLFHTKSLLVGGFFVVLCMEINIYDQIKI